VDRELEERERVCVCVCGIVCVGGLLGKTENLISGMHCASLPLAILTMPVCGGRDGWISACVRVCVCVSVCIIGQ